MKKRKTREEKIRSGYRLQNFRLKGASIQDRKDVSEFSYLASEYVVKDLSKTLMYTVIILGLLLWVKRFLS